MDKTVSTFNSIEMLDLQPTDVSPLMLKCNIKVLYIGGNRNGSFITKPVATEMAKTLRGCPIVGYYKEEKQDFRDHGEKVIIDSEGVRFEKKTRPYGFVAPDAEIWFQKYDESDEFGNVIQREYLVTEGFLWKQYEEEANTVTEAENGRPQSMELDEETLKGHWAEDYNKNMEFFIIDDAMFRGLCILGEDIEPCFEGASIKTVEYSLGQDFKNSLYSMMKDLKKFYNLNKGGEETVEDSMNTSEVVEEVVEETVETTETVETSETTDAAVENVEVPETEETATDFSQENLDASVESITEENQETVENDFVKKTDDEDKDDADDTEDKDDTNDTDDKNETDDDKDDDDKKKYSLLASQYETLQNEYAKLEQKISELEEYKAKIEDKEKDALISEFYMLSDEDKADVIANKSNYSLSEIKSKLSVICFDKKISFEQNDSEDETNITMNLDASVDYSLEDEIPEWVSAVQEKQKEMNY